MGCFVRKNRDRTYFMLINFTKEVINRTTLYVAFTSMLVNLAINS